MIKKSLKWRFFILSFFTLSEKNDTKKSIIKVEAKIFFQNKIITR